MLRRFLFVLLWAVATASGAQAPPQTILVLGDSLSAGYGIDQTLSWVSLLDRRLQEKSLPYRVINASISGDTTSGGRARIARALDTHQPAIVIIELGGNDGLRGLPLTEMQKNLAAIIAQCQQRKARVVLTGMRLPPNYGPQYTEKFQRMYIELAQRYRIALVPFLLEGVAGQPHLMQPDGIHARAVGQPIMLENVWQVLAPMLRQAVETANDTSNGQT